MKKPEKHTNNKKQTLFKVIAVLLPFILILSLELALRVCGYGQNYDLFIEYQANKEYLMFNPNASKRYFTDTRFAPSGNRELFKKKKDAHTIRLFVLGESTTIGYPYFHNGSFHRWLLYRLMHTYPEKNFEIINLSLTAVNSYTVKGFAEELKNYEPDGVLIYTGQNEYYGGLGAGSAQTIAGSPAIVNMILQLRDFRIIQLLMDGYGNFSRSIQKQPESEKTRMEFMVGEQHIAYDSKLFKKGVNQFRYNMNATLSILHEADIPVFFSNLVSNLKDLPPFISDEKKTENAQYYFHTAQTYYEQGEYRKAKEFFIKAKENDLLRFRAPEELNTIIEELCNQYTNTYFVDTKKRLEAEAPHQLPGDELFTDHVHPNLKGYYIMANAFYSQLKQSPLLPPGKTEMSEEQLWQEMPVSPIDSIAGEFRIMKLKGHWPFFDSRYTDISLQENTIEEKLAARFFRKEEDWLTVHNTLYTAYMKLNQPLKAAKVAEGTVLEYAEDPVFYESAAMINGESGNTETAAFYLTKSFGLAPSFEKAHYLTVFNLMADHPEASLPFLNYAINNNSGKLNLSGLKPLVEEVITKKQQLSKEPKNETLLNDIATLYLKMENNKGALIYLDKILQADPTNKKALTLRNSIQ